MYGYKEFCRDILETAGVWVYVNGAQGNLATVEYIKAHESGEHETLTLALRAARIKAGVKPEEILAADCSGLGMYYLQNVNHVLPGDLKARHMKGLCRIIPLSQARVGCWVFMEYPANYKDPKLRGYTHHIGYIVAIENGVLYVVESGSHKSGVVKRRLSSGSLNGRWTSCGVFKQWDKDIFNESEAEEVLQIGDNNEQVGQLQDLLVAAGLGAGMDMAYRKQYGTKTAAAVEAAQGLLGIEKTGKADIQTVLGVAGLAATKKDAAFAMFKAQVRAEGAALQQLAK